MFPETVPLLLLIKSLLLTYRQPPILAISQVAITMGYRCQPGARVSIDGVALVADNGEVADYHSYLESLFWPLQRGKEKYNSELC